MVGWESPSRSDSRHSSYSVIGDSIYLPGYTFSHSSSDLAQPPANCGAPYHKDGNRALDSDAHIQDFAQFVESTKLSYLGNTSNAEFDHARPTESVGSYHSREHMQD